MLVFYQGKRNPLFAMKDQLADIQQFSESVITSFEVWDYLQPRHCDGLHTKVSLILNSLDQNKTAKLSSNSNNFIGERIAVTKFGEDLREISKLIVDFRSFTTSHDPGKRKAAERITYIAERIQSYACELLTQRTISSFSPELN